MLANIRQSRSLGALFCQQGAQNIQKTGQYQKQDIGKRDELERARFQMACKIAAGEQQSPHHGKNPKKRIQERAWPQVLEGLSVKDSTVCRQKQQPKAIDIGIYAHHKADSKKKSPKKRAGFLPSLPSGGKAIACQEKQELRQNFRQRNARGPNLRRTDGQKQ